MIYLDPRDTPRFSAASRSLAILSQVSAISSVACLSWRPVHGTTPQTDDTRQRSSCLMPHALSNMMSMP